MKKLIYQVLIGLFLISPLACEKVQDKPDRYNPDVAAGLVPAYELVTRVIDGDTIVLENGTKVRYIGIDTPETKNPRKPVEYFGKEASEANKKLVEGKKVRLEYDVQRTDKYGRTLAYVYLEDGTFVNACLVMNGLAQVSTYPPNVKYQDEFLELERYAREKKKGLWGK
jgi:micrococcal nuclease